MLPSTADSSCPVDQLGLAHPRTVGGRLQFLPGRLAALAPAQAVAQQFLADRRLPEQTAFFRQGGEEPVIAGDRVVEIETDAMSNDQVAEEIARIWREKLQA